MSYTLSPLAKFTGFDDTGLIVPGGLLYTYAAGTSTPATTYSDSTGTSNANPIVLDSAGRCTIYLDIVNYKFILKTAAGVTLWTQDNIQSTALNLSAVGSVLADFGGDPTVPIVSTSFPVGSTYDKFHAGSNWVAITSTAVPAGTYRLGGMGKSSAGNTTVEVVNITVDSDVLVLSGLVSAATGGVITPLDSFTATAGANLYGIKVKNSLGVGFAWGIKIVRTA